jgi:hypothetical protein
MPGPSSITPKITFDPGTSDSQVRRTVRRANFTAFAARLTRICFDLGAVRRDEDTRTGRLLDRHVARRGERPHDLCRDRDDLLGAHGPDVVGEAAGLQAGERDQILDDVGQDRGALLHAQEHPRLRGRRRLPVAEQQQVEVADDRLQRRAKLVAHPGQELDPCPAGLLGFLAPPLRDHGALRMLHRHDDQLRAALDHPQRPATRAPRAPKHHRDLADDVSVDPDQRDDLDRPESQRLRQPREDGPAPPGLAHYHAVALGQRHSERVDAGAMGADLLQFRRAQAMRHGRDDDTGALVVQQEHAHLRARH